MLFIVHLSRHYADICSMKHTRTIEAATEQDAIEGALDATEGHFFVVDHVEPVNPAEE